MRKVLLILFLFIPFYLRAVPDSLFVAPWGSDGNPGTFAEPWGGWQKAFDEAEPDDTVFFRGGTYYSTAIKKINPQAYPTGVGNSGTLGHPITYMSYPGEWAILDCKYHVDTYGMYNNTYNKALNILYVEHIVFKNFEIRNVFQLDSVIDGAIATTYCRNLTFENIKVHQVAERGYNIQGGAWKSFYDDGGTATVPYWDDEIDTTRFINCDVYELFDTLSSRTYPYPGNNADGWKVSIYRGNVYIFDGCRMWNYSDDAMDLTNVNRGQYFINNCWAMSSNKYYDPEADWNIEGNGFSKLNATRYGADTDVPLFILTNNLAMFCHGHGFANNYFLSYSTRYQTNAVFYNNTAYRNGQGFYIETKVSSATQDSSVYRNNLVYDNDIYAPYGDPNDFYENNATALNESHNTHDEGGCGLLWCITDTVTVTDADFVTVDSATLVALFTAPRQADGSLPLNKPLQLVEGSDLIDKGMWYATWEDTEEILSDMGFLLDTIGDAPDIGYAEYGIASEGNTATDITSFTFANIVGVATIDTDDHTVTAVLQAGEDVSAITPTFTLSSGATSDPASGVEDDFTNPVTVTVTAEDEETEQEWTVTITVDDDPVPTVATVATTSANYNAFKASVTGRIYSANGGTLTARGICWSETNTSPTTSDKHTKYTPYVGNYTDVISGLRGDKTYYFRAYATTSEGGASYGDAITITTPEHTIVGNYKYRDGKIVVYR